MRAARGNPHEASRPFSECGREVMETGQAPQLRQLANIFRRRWKLLAASAIACAALAATIGIIIGPRFTAKAQIIVDPRKGGSAGEQAAAGSNSESIVETQVAMIVSDVHLRRVLDSLRAETKGEQSGPADKPASLDFASLELDTLRSRVRAFAERRSWVIGITFTSSNPAMAAAVANRMAQVYVAAATEFDRDSRKDLLASLAERIPRARARVEKADAALQSYRISSGFPEPNQPDAVDQQIVDLNRQLAVASSELADRQARLSALRNSKHREYDDARPFIDVLNGPPTRDRDGALDATPYRSMLAVPQRIDLQKSRTTTDPPVQENLNQAATGTDIIESRIGSLQQRLSTLQHASIETRQAQVRLRELQREATAATEAYERLLQRQNELLVERDASPEVRVLSSALPPELPSSPNPTLFILPAMICALIGAGLLAVVLEGLDQRLRSDRDVEDALGISCLGIIPRVPGRRRMSPHQHLLNKPVSPYSEAIRSVVTAALELWNPKDAPKLFLVTSSVRGEGKSTLACSFAAYAAVLSRRVLLIDLDLQCCTIMRELGTATGGGIPDILRGRPAAEVIRHIPELGLDYLPGARPFDPVLVVAHDRFGELLRSLKENYDCVVIDCGPLLGRTEARLVAPMIDRVLFAVRWGGTRWNIAQQALSRLAHSGAQNPDLRVCAVITQADLRRHASRRIGDFSEVLFYSKPTS
jgi:succinoglycan biosynthesis transport protein ExoP